MVIAAKVIVKRFITRIVISFFNGLCGLKVVKSRVGSGSTAAASVSHVGNYEKLDGPVSFE